MIEICTIGGYDEVGRNMTAVKYGDEIVIFDMGIHLESFIEYKGNKEQEDLSEEELHGMGAIPDDSVIEDMVPMVKAIVPTHAHLDHVGAIPFLSNKYSCPIIATPYTAEVLERLALNYRKELTNRVIRQKSGSIYKLSENLAIEFVSMTHSTPQSTMAALHTPEGVVVYANDFKLDDHPTMGNKPDYQRIKELSQEKIACLILDSTYARLDESTPSESVAGDMLKDILLDKDTKGKAVIVTTFSSHLARLKTILECGKAMKRKVVFLGRSLARYVDAGEAIGIANFQPDVELVRYGKQIKKRLKEISSERDKYLLVVTGHQGEPDATLSKMANGTYDFPFKEDDIIVFSCKVIPSELNENNRETLEDNLDKFHVKIYRDIHVSGHGAREDHRAFLELAKPKHLIPSHGNIDMRQALASLAAEMGYPKDNVHMSKNGTWVIIQA